MGMRRHAHRPALVLAASSVLLAGAPAQAADADLQQLAWLSGCWRSDDAEAGSVEQWLPLAGASLLGMSRTVRQGRMVAFEFMRIAADPAGTLTFFAQPSGKPATAFPMRSLGDGEVVFEDLAHDFPQRVSYRFVPPARLLASIEGLRGGVLRRIDFPMTRSSCGG